MKKQFKQLVLAIALAIPFIFSSCKEENNVNDTVKTGEVNLEFEHVWGMNEAPFNLNETLVHPLTGDTLNIQMLKYYISNIVLIKADGSVWKQQESYHLISPTENIISLKDVPEGDYTSMKLTIGVDSTRNCSGLQSGALSPNNGMFWSWSTGYIFFRMEGTSPQSNSGNLVYHLGGYKFPYSAINERTISFPQILSVKRIAAPQVHLKSNVAKIWHGGVKIKDVNMIHNIGNMPVQMLGNFAGSIYVDHVHQ